MNGQRLATPPGVPHEGIGRNRLDLSHDIAFAQAIGPHVGILDQVQVRRPLVSQAAHRLEPVTDQALPATA